MRIALVCLVIVSYAVASEAAPAAMPKLRTGERKLVEHPNAIAAEVVAHFLDAHEELIEAHLNAPKDQLNVSLVSASSAGGGAVFAFVEGTKLWLRRPAADATKALSGDVYVAGSGIDPSGHYHFTLAPIAASSADASARRAFGTAAANFFDNRSSGAFDNFASNRMRAQYGLKVDSRRTPRTRWGSDDLGRLMDTTTGMTSIQETLQIDRALWLRTLKEKPSVPLASLKPPPLAQHPFDAMLRALKKPVPEEKLASAAPADFYYARLNDLSVFFRIVDQLDAWATPAVTALEGGGDDHAIAERTLTQLGLERSQLARTLGTAVVADLAVVGSDPYVREGSDVTILFRVKQKALFDGALANALSHHNETHPGVNTSALDAGGVTVRISRSLDGAVRQHRASVGDLEIVSNSLAATRHVLEVIAGRAPRLSDEPDWKYMMARTSEVPCDGLVYLGDRFIGEVVGPRQKILEARRQLALSELLVPGYAALLYGWIEGHAPASAEVLIDGGWLHPDELSHIANGEPIAFKPGRSARSAWGTSAAMTPLYDLPAPQLVTPAEQSAYEWFATSYQNYWRQYIDPVAIRLSIAPDGTSALKLTADVRILPLIEDSEYNRISRMVGRAKIVTPALGGGMRWSMGIGADASLRRDLTQLSRNSPLGERIALDWLGDWLLVGVEDRIETVRGTWLALDSRNDLPQAPADSSDRETGRRDMYATALQTPLYLAFGVDNVVGAALFLTVAKKFVGDASPSLVALEREGPRVQGTTHRAHLRRFGEARQRHARRRRLVRAQRGRAHLRAVGARASSHSRRAQGRQGHARRGEELERDPVRVRVVERGASAPAARLAAREDRARLHPSLAQSRRELPTRCAWRRSPRHRARLRRRRAAAARRRPLHARRRRRARPSARLRGARALACLARGRLSRGALDDGGLALSRGDRPRSRAARGRPTRDAEPARPRHPRAQAVARYCKCVARNFSIAP